MGIAVLGQPLNLPDRDWALVGGTNAAAIPASELGRQLQDMFTRYGFTSVFDLSSLWENTRQLRGRVESAEVPGPRICSTGEGLVPRARFRRNRLSTSWAW